MIKRFNLIILIMFGVISTGFLSGSNGNLQFSLGEYILDDEPNPGCLKEGKDDKIYISDKLTYLIRVFSSKGKYLYSMGGKGEGPGQFKRWIGAYDIDYNGEICQIDFANGNGRITRFSPEGKIIESFRIVAQKKNWGMSIFCRSNGDLLVDLGGSPIIERHNKLFYMGGTSSFCILDKKGVWKETIHEDKFFYDFSSETQDLWPHIPYLNYMVSAYNPTRDTLAFQKTTADQVTIVDLKTKKKLCIPNGFKSTSLTKQDIDLWLQVEKKINPLFNILQPYYNKFRRYGIDFITNKPIVDRIFFNTQGELFISQFDKTKGKHKVHKFSIDNKFLQMKMLDRIPVFIGKDRVYYMIYNENEETYTVEVKKHDDFFKGR